MPAPGGCGPYCSIQLRPTGRTVAAPRCRSSAFTITFGGGSGSVGRSGKSKSSLGCVAMFFFARAVELLGATRAATLSVMVPVVALLLAGLWLREPLSLLQILGAGLAVAGMLAAVLFTGRKSA